MAYKTDFAELKQRFTIEKVADLLGLTLKPSGQTLRGECPACNDSGHRDLAITPGKGFFCWRAKQGGDLIQLVAHIRACEVREAAEWLDRTSSREPSPRKGTVPRTEPERGMKALDYLEADHPAVEALGFAPEIAVALGIGWAATGTMKNHVLIPIRLEDGAIAGYIGVEEIATLPKQWHIDTNVTPFPKRA
jgi:hypothetical protein